MFQAYPFVLSDAGNGAVMAQFVDVPGALTQGDDEELAIHWAPDALHVALTGYIDFNQDIPRPSKPAKGQRIAYLDPLVAMKLEVYQGMRERGWTRVALADAMGIDEKSVRRLIDLDHKSKVDQIVAALRVLGKGLVIDVRDLQAVG
jgi:antitoxin HicB